jgi:DNA-binding transcriptional LysR family regulator
MTTLNLGYLATFRLVIQRGSFSAAADVLGISQPAVSLQIRQLEQFLQTRLVERTGRGIKATAAGQRCWRMGSVFSRRWMTPSGP